MVVKFHDGFSDESMNALYTSLKECADDDLEAKTGKRIVNNDNYNMYMYLENTPRTSLVAELVNKLRELGYDIMRMH